MDAAEQTPSKASAFSKLEAGLEDAIAYHRGARQLTVRDVELKPHAPMGAKEVLAVRARLRVSQAAFARILNVSKAVQPMCLITRHIESPSLYSTGEGQGPPSCPAGARLRGGPAEGPHVIVRCGRCSTVVPVHGGEDLAPGTLRAIERQLGPCLGKGWLRRV